MESWELATMSVPEARSSLTSQLRECRLLMSKLPSTRTDLQTRRQSVVRDSSVVGDGTHSRIVQWATTRDGS